MLAGAQCWDFCTTPLYIENPLKPLIELRQLHVNHTGEILVLGGHFFDAITRRFDQRKKVVTKRLKVQEEMMGTSTQKMMSPLGTTVLTVYCEGLQGLRLPLPLGSRPFLLCRM